MKIKTIDVNAKEWFDKVNGNSYFSGEIIINYGMKSEKTITMPFQYGYGDHYLDTACDMLDKAKLINNDSYNRLPRYCRYNDIILRYNKKENCLKREL
jgi:hypothetical protein